MKRYNVLMVFSPDTASLLMCRRMRPPYEGKYNLPGGKVEPGETGEEAAYRELLKETAIARIDIRLHHVMDLTYYYEDSLLEVYAGRLIRPVDASGDENPLCWMPTGDNFFDQERFAGMGNIGHMLEQVRAFADEILA